ncbi:ubiquitin-protein transferase [Aureococcus anophagefferens]|uniref:HECT-type E3 ubiquitin transferase n=2 Tax=Aureococcus anophagefferens TaxID=44056 RepID=A0ABR1FVK7_AURAN
MFDGSDRSKRQIRLGGRKTDSNSAELLRRARVEREARAAEKRRQASALRLAAWYRGRRAAKRWRRGLRATWDKNVADLGAIQAVFAAKGAAFAAPPATALALTRAFLAFHSDRDGDRLETCCALAAGALRGDRAARRVAPTARGARLLAAVFDLAARADASPALRAPQPTPRRRQGGPRRDAVERSEEPGKLGAGGTVEATAQRQEEDDDDDSDDEPRTATSTTLNKVVLLDAAVAAAVDARDRSFAPTGDRSCAADVARLAKPFAARLFADAADDDALAAAAAFGAAVIARAGRAPRSRVAFGHQPTLVSAVVDAVAFGRRGAAVDGLWRLAATRNDEAALSLFCVAYSQRLLTMDDETLLAQGTGTIAAVVAKLRDFLYETLWVGQVLQAQEPAACGRLLLVAAAARLLSHLRDRVGRAPGLDGDDLWRWRDVRLSERLAEDSAAPRPDSSDDDDDAMDVDAQALPWASNNGRRRRQPMDVDGPPAAAADDGAALSREPRVAQVLAAVPFVVPFVQRVALFQALVDGDRRAHQSDAAAALAAIRPLGVRAKVRRDALFDDSMAALADLPADQLKSRVQITFVNEAGHEEAGIDGGGVFKEFLDELSKAAFDPERGGLFRSATDGALYAGGGARDASTLRKYEFCGRVIAKALYERVLVEPRFARFFLNKALGKYNYFDDLRSLDAGLYAQLSRLKNLDDADLAALDLRFEVTSVDARGRPGDVPLAPGGRDTAVDASNRARYVQLVAHHRLNVETRRPSAAFLRGLRAVVPARWLKMFDAEELQTLVSGDDRPLDVEDWRAHAHYGGGYHPSQPIIAWFWEVVAEFSAEDRAGLLRFITSCSRPPLLGFKCLNPLISIHKVQIASDEERLPTAGTCMNLLKLPNYSSKAALKEKLLYSIRNAHGFELS